MCECHVDGDLLVLPSRAQTCSEIWAGMLPTRAEAAHALGRATRRVAHAARARALALLHACLRARRALRQSSVVIGRHRQPSGRR